MFHLTRRPYDYQGSRAGSSDRGSSNTSVSIVIGAAMIAVALLLSTLITALGGRYVGLESTTEDSAWLIDRMTGAIYRCQSSGRGKAACDAELTTGSLPSKSR